MVMAKLEGERDTARMHDVLDGRLVEDHPVGCDAEMVPRERPVGTRDRLISEALAARQRLPIPAGLETMSPGTLYDKLADSHTVA